MKIKLNISKNLKRELKERAEEKKIARNDYIYDIIEKFIKEKELLWSDKIENIIKIASSEEISLEDRAKKAMKKTSKNLQPIILNVDEKTFFALSLIAKKNKEPLEKLIINLLKQLT